MDKRISEKCWIIKLIQIARKRHNNIPILPLRNHYIDGYSPAKDNDGFHLLHYHIRPDKKGTAYCVAIHETTEEIIY